MGDSAIQFMNRCHGPQLLFLFALVLPLPGGTAHAAALVRGPYLQIATPDSMRIRWRTDEATESLVFYGTNPNNLHLLNGDLEATTEHEVRLLGLTPATRYYYSIGDFSEALAE